MNTQDLNFIKSLSKSYDFMERAKSRAYLLSKEISAIDFVVENIKNEKLVLCSFSAENQVIFEYKTITNDLESKKTALIKSVQNYKCIASKPINLN